VAVRRYPVAASKKSPRLEVIVVRLVPAAKADAQRLLDILTFNRADRRSRDQGACRLIPEFKIPLEVPNLFRAEIDDGHLDFDWDRIAVTVEKAAGIEIVLVDRRRAVDAIWTEREIDCLDDG
jgi:hypothetical protein